ncbi:MAG: glutamate--tRNA ligase [Bacteroidota bacterium]
MTGKVRVRFAPSPTGYLHVGGLRTALYNFLFARKYGGSFILRIEDTDRTRYVKGAVENLIETLRWAGIEYDEGPDKGGAFGPYIQSERLELYRQYAQMLLEQGKAYRCFCSEERLETMRREQQRRGIPSKYDRTCLRLSATEIQQKIDSGVPYAIRMKMPESSIVRFHDLIRGEIEFQSDTLDDQVLLKSDGYPTYHLANVVDDHLMGITHVIRGEEWLSSTPKHVLLYEFFGWEKPQFAHLPLLLNPDRSKLSKRQGDVAVEEYRAKGYLKEALVNFVALLGWNPGDDREILTLDELQREFSLERVNKSGAIFNIEKLNWLNFQHLRRKPDVEVLAMLKEHLSKSSLNTKSFDDEYLLKVITVMRDRVSFVREFLEKSPYFFKEPVEYDEATVKKRWKKESAGYLKAVSEEFAKLSDPQKSDYEAALQLVADRLKVGKGELIHPLRLAVSGKGEGPGLFDILCILGKDETLRRIDLAIQRLK